jgi:hypothetical protein
MIERTQNAMLRLEEKKEDDEPPRWLIHLINGKR